VEKTILFSNTFKYNLIYNSFPLMVNQCNKFITRFHCLLIFIKLGNITAFRLLDVMHDAEPLRTGQLSLNTPQRLPLTSPVTKKL